MKKVCVAAHYLTGDPSVPWLTVLNTANNMYSSMFVSNIQINSLPGSYMILTIAHSSTSTM